jgi:hypothetical protein
LGVGQSGLCGAHPSLRRYDVLLLGLQLRSQSYDIGSGGLDFGLKTGLFVLQKRHGKVSYGVPDNHVLA